MKLLPPNPVQTTPPARARCGMALVITLIMLSVTLIMAIAFLAVSNRERAAVTTSADQANARLALDSALNAAQAQILANVIASGDGPYNFGLLVSTNFINSYGFQPNNTSPTNVNFDYRSTGTTLLAGDFEANVANLLYLPRAPVMVSAAEPNGRFYLDLNRNGVFDQTIASTNPFLPAETSKLFVNENGTTNFDLTVTNIQTGDPQWIGQLERPDTMHSPNNLFTYRYAFIAVPIGNGLDANYIHNQTFFGALNSSKDGFFRNQGVGSWEINLAAFLTDLNVNQWDPATEPYDYEPGASTGNRGAGFEDAFSVLAWRYNGFYGTLLPATSYFANAANVFPFDNIDEYSDGPLQSTTTNISENFLNQDVVGNPWAGADSTNHFFNLPSELFDPTKSSSFFTNHLISAGTYTTNGAQPTYDRYTYYRMLSELGVESVQDDSGKLDLNYDNTDGHGNIVRGAQTNLVPWTALAFFTNAADRMLRSYSAYWFQSSPSNYLATYYNTNYNYYYTYTNSSGYGVVVTNDPNGFGLTNVPFFGITNQIPAFGITNIPVLIGGVPIYSSAVNRVLQLAANIYDASTNTAYPFSGFFPSAFRPQFYRDPILGNIFILGYEQVVNLPGGISDPQLAQPIVLRALPAGVTATAQGNMVNVFGVPWIIGAKKYLPSFNQFCSLNTLQATRKVQFTRDAPVAYDTAAHRAEFHTNEIYVLSITNHVGCSFWNSYITNYPGGTLSVVARDSIYMQLDTNNALFSVGSVLGSWEFLSPSVFSIGFTNFVSSWPGSGWDITSQPGTGTAAANSFIYSNWDCPFLPQAVYPYQGGFAPASFGFDTNLTSNPVFPDFQLMTTNRFQAFILDGTHVIDYVQFDGPDGAYDLANAVGQNESTLLASSMWLTNGYLANPPPPTMGFMNQIAVSKSPGTLPPGIWNSPPNMPPGLGNNQTAEGDDFAGFFTADWYWQANPKLPGVFYINTNLQMQAPYTPVRTVTIPTVWIPNDPLVHYLPSDLNELVPGLINGLATSDDPSLAPVATPSPNSISDRYQPWGRVLQLMKFPGADTNQYNLAYRDPLVYSSDDWDFPGNRYPTIGWLGRVHRGTPWQTVFLKATNILSLSTPLATSGFITWTNWSGDGDAFDAQNSSPAEDDILFDIFTTALDDNASRGTLSVNQAGIAAWSAILTGVNVISNDTETPVWYTAPAQTNLFINPAGTDNITNSALLQILEGTNGINAVRGLYPNGAFTRIGDIVRVPALAERSPYLNTSDATHREYDISDEMYERIPQQIMGLLRVGSPRYVIYCYGQALRPAQDGTALDLAHNGLVTNYQVVAESLARAVVSVHPQVVYHPPLPPATNYTTSVDSYNLLPPN